MDKNTLWGLVLMGAIMFGFLYLSKPSEAEIAAERERSEQARAQAESKNTPTVVPFTAADSSALAGAVRAMGKTADNAISFSDNNLDLSLDNENGLSGTVSAGGAKADIRDVLANKASLTAAQSAKAAQAIRAFIDNAVKYEGFARYLGGESTVTTLENEVVKLTVDSRGALISSVELKKYQTEVGPEPANIILFGGDTDSYSFRFNTKDQRLDTRDFNFDVTAEGDSAVLLSMSPADGAMWGIRYTLSDTYTVRMEVVQKGMDAILPANTVNMEMDWHQKMARNELGRTFEERNSAIAYKYVGEGVDEMSASGDDSKSLNGRLRWVAFKNQFFSSVLIAKEPLRSAELSSVDIKNDKYLKDMTMAATVPYTPADGTAASFDFYFGPNDYPLLSKLDDTLNHDEDLSLTRLIPLGWGIFRWVNTLIVIPTFTFLGSFISNYGIIILLLTIFIKIIIFPFTFKSFKSQAKMRVLAPEIKEINDKYPGQENAMKRQQETDARADCHVLLLPLGHRAARPVLPLGSRPVGSRCHIHPALLNSLLRQPRKPLLPAYDNSQHRVYARKHAVAARRPEYARNEDDAVHHARDVPLHIQRLRIGPELLLPRVAAHNDNPDMGIPPLHRREQGARADACQPEEAPQEKRLDGSPRRSTASGTGRTAPAEPPPINTINTL